MLQRFMIVGLGGSGTMTVRFLERELRNRLAAVRERQIPPSWRLLAIDVRSDQEREERHERLLGTHDVEAFLPLTGTSLEWDNLRSHIASAADPRAVDSWSPWIGEVVGLDITKGAGQFRAIGRSVAIPKLEEIQRWLRARVPQRNDDARLRAITKAFGYRTAGQASTVAVVVASMAGGTGAGLVLDVCDVLRSMGTEGNETWGNNVVAVLYTPEVFEDLDEADRAGVHGNALALTSELMARMWASESQGGDQAIFTSAGAGLRSVHRGPRFALLVGRRTMAGVSPSRQRGGGSDHRVAHFESMARAIAGWMSDPTTQERIDSYFAVNVPKRLDNTTRLSLDHEASPTAMRDLLSAMGFATVSLGNALFLQYATERLARKAADILLGGGTAEQVNDSVANHFSNFVIRAGLSEKGDGQKTRSPHDDQVIDALRGNRRQRVNEFLADWRKRWVRVKWSVDEWVDQLGSETDKSGATFARSERDNHYVGAAGRWVHNTQDRLVALTEEYVGRFGLRVGVALLEELERDLVDAVEGLRTQAKQRQPSIKHAQRRFAEKLGPARGKLAVGSEAVQRGFENAEHILSYQAEAELREFAAEILEDAIKGLVEPLKQALLKAERSLQSERNDPGARTTVVGIRDWADKDAQKLSVPSRLHPDPTTVLIHPVDDPEEGFDARLFRALEGVYGAEKDAGTRLANAAGEALRGLDTTDQHRRASMDDEPPKGRLIMLDPGTRWRPPAIATMQGVLPSVASFEVRASAADLLTHAEDWLRGVAGPIGASVASTLAEFLAEGGQGAAKRFKEALTEALDMAQPLVQIGSNAMSRVHLKTSPEMSRWVSALPVGPDDDLFAEVKKLLGGDDAAEMPSLAKEISEVTVTTWLRPPLHMSVFSSITGPIKREMDSRRASLGSWTEFWRWKRASRLDGFVPVPSKVRRRLVRGYLVADMLGLLRASEQVIGPESEDVGDLFEVFDPTTRSDAPVPFPFPLLTPSPRGNGSALAAILESLPVALVEYGEANQPTAEAALRSYWVLLDLAGGKPGRLGEPARRVFEKGPTVAHARWLENEAQNKLLEGFDTRLSPEERVRFAREWLDEKARWHEDTSDESAASTRETTGPQVDEIVGDIKAAIAELRISLEGVTEGGVKDKL